MEFSYLIRYNRRYSFYIVQEKRIPNIRITPSLIQPINCGYFYVIIVFGKKVLSPQFIYFFFFLKIIIFTFHKSIINILGGRIIFCPNHTIQIICIYLNAIIRVYFIGIKNGFALIYRLGKTRRQNIFI